MAERILRQHLETTGAPEVRAQLRENKKLKALPKWLWMILSVVVGSYQASVSSYPSQQKEMSQNSTSAAQDTVHQNTFSAAGLTVGQAVMQLGDSPRHI